MITRRNVITISIVSGIGLVFLPKIFFGENLVTTLISYLGYAGMFVGVVVFVAWDKLVNRKDTFIKNIENQVKQGVITEEEGINKQKEKIHQEIEKQKMLLSLEKEKQKLHDLKDQGKKKINFDKIVGDKDYKFPNVLKNIGPLVGQENSGQETPKAKPAKKQPSNHSQRFGFYPSNSKPFSEPLSKPNKDFSGFVRGQPPSNKKKKNQLSKWL